MTKLEYVKSHLTKWDVFKLNFIIAPAALLLGFVLKGLILGGGDFSQEEGRIVIILFIILGVITGVLHSSASKKKKSLIEEFDEKRRLGQI